MVESEKVKEFRRALGRLDGAVTTCKPEAYISGKTDLLGLYVEAEADAERYRKLRAWATSYQVSRIFSNASTHSIDREVDALQVPGGRP